MGLINKNRSLKEIEINGKSEWVLDYDLMETYLEKTFIPLNTGNHTLEGFFVYSLDTTSADFIMNFRIIETASGNIVKSLTTKRKELQDSSGTGVMLDILKNGLITPNNNDRQADTGTDQRSYCAPKLNVMLTSGVQYTLKLLWGASVDNQEAAIYEGEISIEEKLVTAS